MGEICYNLRTALDYLVFEMVKNDSGRAEDFTQFPIVDSRDKFRAWEKKHRRKGMKPAHTAMFEPLQPYKGFNWTALLGEFSNKDKHREFPVLRGIVTGMFYSSDSTPEFERLNLPVFSTVNPTTGKEVQVKFNLAGSVSYRDGPPIMESLEKIKAAVAETLEAFKPEFG